MSDSFPDITATDLTMNGTSERKFGFKIEANTLLWNGILKLCACINLNTSPNPEIMRCVSSNLCSSVLSNANRLGLSKSGNSINQISEKLNISRIV